MIPFGFNPSLIAKSQVKLDNNALQSVVMAFTRGTSEASLDTGSQVSIKSINIYGLGVFGGSDCTFKTINLGVGNLRY